MRSGFPGAPVLAALLGRSGIKLVDVGGRGSAFPPLVPLAPHADYYVSEPDAAEAARLEETLALDTPWRSVTVLTEAIASRRGEAELWMTQQPGMSSLLEPDPHVAERFYLGRKFQVVSVAKVPTIPLDEAAERYGFADACFLKVDTQGTELDILQSGPRLVGGPLLGIHVESLFQPFYKGQSLFSDVDSHLRANGFSLFSLSRTCLRRAGYRPSSYSKRVVTWAHCLYLREPETLMALGSDTRARQLPRLLGLALAFQFYDLAFEILDRCRRDGLLTEPDCGRLTDEIASLSTADLNQMVRKAEGRGQVSVVDMMLAPSLRDRKRLE